MSIDYYNLPRMIEPNFIQSQQELIAALKEMQDIKNVRAIESFVERNYMQPHLIAALMEIIENSSLENLIEQKHLHFLQQAASTLNSIIKKQLDSKDTIIQFEPMAKYFFNLLLNWNIKYDVKKLFSRSFSAFLDKWETQLDSFFEIVMETLINLLEAAPYTRERQLSELISSQNLHQEFIVAIYSSPNKMHDAYHVTIFIYDSLFEHCHCRSSVYLERMMEDLKKLHQLLFKENIQVYFAVFKHLFEFWGNFNMISLDLKKSLQPVYAYISNWHQLTDDIRMVLDYKSTLVEEHENALNYCLLTEDWQSHNLIKLKYLALDAFNDIIMIQWTVQINFDVSPLSKSMKQMFSSIFSTLEYLVISEKAYSEDFSDISIALLNCLSYYIESQGLQKTIHFKILFGIVLPSIKFQVEQHSHSLDEDIESAEAMLEELNDCCDAQKVNSILSISCKLLEKLAEQDEGVCHMVRHYALYTLIEHFNSNIPDIKIELSAYAFYPYDVASSFLLLTMLSYSQREIQLQADVLSVILTWENFSQLTDYQKKYCYLYLSYNWYFLFNNCEEKANFYLTYCLTEQCSQSTRVFILDFISNICQDYYSQTFITLLLQRMQNLPVEKILWQIISKTLRKHIHRINEDLVLHLVENFHKEALRLVKICQGKIAKGEGYNNYEIMLHLNICRQVAREHDYIKDKPRLIESLYSVVHSIKTMCRVLIDDEVVWVGCELLEVTKRFPEQFFSLLEKVNEGFQSSEYRGMNYYTFFGLCIEIVNQYPYNCEMKNIVDKIYLILIEGFSYLAQYPEDLNDQQYENISSLEYLLQSLFILYGDKLDKQCVQETKQINEILLSRIVDQEQYILQIRTHNLLLTCQILSQKKYQINEILRIAEEQHLFSSSDSILSIYLFNQIRTELSEEGRYQLLLIILYIFKSAKAYKECKILSLKEKLKKQNSILNYVIRPVELENSPLDQARVFFADYEKENPQSKQLIIKTFKQSNHHDLFQFLSKIENRSSSERVQAAFENLNINSICEEEEDYLDMAKEQEAGSGSGSQRKYFKVVGNKMANHNSSSFSPQHALKRSLAIEYQEEDEIVEPRKKKRHMDEIVLVPDLQRSKKEIRLQKMHKKAHRS